MGAKSRKIVKDAGSYAFLLVMSAFVLVPLAWFLVTSLKQPADVTAYPPSWIPRPFTLGNYEAVIIGSNLPRYFLNSLIVAAATIVLTLVLASHVGYVAARYKFAFKNSLLFVILATSMVPGISILPALYVLANSLNLNDTYIVLILIYTAWQVPSTIWLMQGFFESVPVEIEEAAMMDGCSRLQAFYRVVVPICQPGLAAATIMIFLFVWNDWLIAMALTVSENMRVLPVGLYNYIKDLGVQWGKFSAYTIISVIPVITIFLLLQTRFIEGLTAGARKG